MLLKLVLTDEVGVVDVTQFSSDASTPIFMDSVHCSGDENSLFDCQFTSLPMCSVNDDVGIICHRK